MASAQRAFQAQAFASMKPIPVFLRCAPYPPAQIRSRGTPSNARGRGKYLRLTRPPPPFPLSHQPHARHRERPADGRYRVLEQRRQDVHRVETGGVRQAPTEDAAPLHAAIRVVRQRTERVWVHALRKRQRGGRLLRVWTGRIPERQAQAHVLHPPEAKLRTVQALGRDHRGGGSTRIKS